MNKPKISVITPLYNSANFIVQTIESVQRQTYRNYEHIIIDDCSKDESYALAKQKASEDDKIILLRNETNSHVAYTRNKGIEIASGEYVLFLDSDDLLSEDALEILINFMLSIPDAMICAGQYRKMSESEQYLYGIIKVPKYITYKNMLKTCSMSTLTTLLNVKVIGSKRFKNIPHEDYLFWLSILAEGHTCYGCNEKPLGFYRLTSNSLSRNKFKTIRYQWNIYRNELKFSMLESSYYFCFYAVHGLIKYLK